MTAEAVQEKVKELCVAHHARCVILFGSRAKGTALQCSDIDIAVSGVSDMETLREEIDEIPTLFTVDLVDLDTCANALLIEDIYKYGHEI